MISDFNGGGTKAQMRVYEWDDTCTRTNVPDSDCVEQNLRILGFSSGAKGEWCPTIGDNDPYCGVVNVETTTGSWNHFDKRQGSVMQYRPNTFFEGGINLSSLGLDNECFGSVMAETRSSTSLTATLKDFVIGEFQDCTSGLVTAPALSDGTLIQIPQGGTVPTVSIGTEAQVNVADRNILTITGAGSWSGTLDNYLCGPTPVTSSELCDKTASNVIFESSKEVTGGSAPVTLVSDWTTVTSAGRYCWYGEFTTTIAGLPGATDGSAGECFIVTPLRPTIETSAATTVLLGQPIYDVATLAGTAKQPDGSDATGGITFTVYGPYASATPATCELTANTFATVAVTSGDGEYSSGTWTPVAAGYYFWIANYSGNLPNTESTTGTCGASGETTYVEVVIPTISTRQSFFPQDSATITVAHGGVGNITGTVTFELYVGSLVCAGPMTGDWTSGVSGASSVPASTNNTTISVSDGTTAFSWNVWFTSTNGAIASIPKSPATCREKTSLSISDGTSYSPTP